MRDCRRACGRRSKRRPPNTNHGGILKAGSPPRIVFAPPDPDSVRDRHPCGHAGGRHHRTPAVTPSQPSSVTAGRCPPHTTQSLPRSVPSAFYCGATSVSIHFRLDPVLSRSTGKGGGKPDTDRATADREDGEDLPGRHPPGSSLAANARPPGARAALMSAPASIRLTDPGPLRQRRAVHRTA